jgi:RNA polymerase sigma-70 factor (ECF subfamily)
MADKTEVGDPELVTLAKQGDTRAFDELVRRYHRRVYSLALRMLRDHDAADDICQEAFLRAYRAMGRFREGASFCPWIYKIATNLCLNALRDRKRLVSIADAPETAEAVDPHQEDCSERTELLSKVDKALESISPKYRMPLLLRVQDGLSYAEISELLHIPRGTVMSRINRAREKLRMLVGGEEVKKG